MTTWRATVTALPSCCSTWRSSCRTPPGGCAPPASSVGAWLMSSQYLEIDTNTTAGSDNYASSVCPDSHKAKCEECLKFRELCPYCNNIRKLNKLCEVISLYGIP